VFAFVLADFELETAKQRDLFLQQMVG